MPTPFFKLELCPIVMAKDVYNTTPREKLYDFHLQIFKKKCVMRNIIDRSYHLDSSDFKRMEYIKNYKVK